MEKLEAFLSLYRSKLATCMAEHPEDYMPGITADVVADRMSAAIRSKGIRGVNIDSRGFRATTKTLGIKNTYKAIEAYLGR